MIVVIDLANIMVDVELIVLDVVENVVDVKEMAEKKGRGKFFC